MREQPLAIGSERGLDVVAGVAALVARRQRRASPEWAIHFRAAGTNSRSAGGPSAFLIGRLPMKTIASVVSGFLFTGLLALAPQSASALNSRSWVSNAGSDAAACTLTAPCATFQKAIDSTSPGGTVNCLNSGLFIDSTPVFTTITKAITLVGAVDASSKITAGATDRVVLEGLSLDGSASFINWGVRLESGGFAYLIDCSVQGYVHDGIFLGSTTPNARFFIQNSRIQGNAQSGVNVQPAGSTVNIASIVNTLIDSNGPVAVKLLGPGAVLGLQNSTLNGSPAAITLSGGAQAFTVGQTNSVNGTFTFTGTIPLN
jgi:hypothetical protein